MASLNIFKPIKIKRVLLNKYFINKLPRTGMYGKN